MLKHQYCEIFLDIETTGFNEKTDKITCICAREISLKDGFLLASKNQQWLLKMFSEWIKKYDPEKTLLITFNGFTFDLPFLAFKGVDLSDYRHYDVMLHEARLNNGGWSKLKNRGLNGIDAVRMFEKNELRNLENYNSNDVNLLMERYKKVLSQENAST